MSNPPPPGFQPPTYQYAPQKRGPSCWAVGGIGCLVIFILGAVLTFLAINRYVHSKTGHEFMEGFTSAMKTSAAGAECVAPMTEIRKAILRYHEHEGKYPDNLTQLASKYLPAGVTLHCGVDQNDDPSHVTYEYFKPTDKTPPSAILLRYSWPVSITIAGQTSTQTMTEQITLDGTVSETQTSSTTMPVSPPGAGSATGH